MIGELFINGKDAQAEWGVTLESSGLSALMTPAPIKEFVENKSRLSHGKQVLTSYPRVDERDVQLTLFISSKDVDSFFMKYGAFVAELQKGPISIRTKYEATTLYRMIYMSCVQFSQFNGRLGKFVLKLNEPNPNNRAL